jgi:hypothetical protein
MNRAEMLGRAIARRTRQWCGGGAAVAVDAGHAASAAVGSDFEGRQPLKLCTAAWVRAGAISLVMERQERGSSPNAPHLVIPRIRRPKLRMVGIAVLRRRPQIADMLAGRYGFRKSRSSPRKTRRPPADHQDRGLLRGGVI